MGTQTSSQGDPVEIDGPVHFDGVDKIPAADLWAIRRTLRGRLVEEVRRRIRDTALSRGATEAEVGWTETAFDPDVLTIGFARRVPSYKRLTLMLRDPERLRSEERRVGKESSGRWAADPSIAVVAATV